MNWTPNKYAEAQPTYKDLEIMLGDLYRQAVAWREVREKLRALEVILDGTARSTIPVPVVKAFVENVKTILNGKKGR